MTFPLISGAQAYPHLAILSFIRKASLFSQSKLPFFPLKLLFCLPRTLNPEITQTLCWNVWVPMKHWPVDSRQWASTVEELGEHDKVTISIFLYFPHWYSAEDLCNNRSKPPLRALCFWTCQGALGRARWGGLGEQDSISNEHSHDLGPGNVWDYGRLKCREKAPPIMLRLWGDLGENMVVVWTELWPLLWVIYPNKRMVLFSISTLPLSLPSG